MITEIDNNPYNYDDSDHNVNFNKKCTDMITNEDVQNPAYQIQLKFF